MRIFIAVRHSTDPRYFYGGLWKSNFYPALRELGHELIESGVDLLPASRFMSIPSGFTPQELAERARITENILEEVRTALLRGPVDLFLSYFYNSHFDPQGFDELRRLGIPSVNFYCNSIHQFELVSEVSSGADFAWHAERDARESYLRVGANPIWVQMAADPDFYHPVSGRQRQSKAVFVGQKYADRERWLAEVINAKLPIDVYGSGWKPEPDSQVTGDDQSHYLGRRAVRPGSVSSYARRAAQEFRSGGLLGGIQRVRQQAVLRRESRAIAEIIKPHIQGRAADLAEVLARYEVCLNFSNVWADGRPGSRLIPHVRLRDFEGPMCRTCYLTGHSDEVTEFYKVGVEIDTYRNAEELVDKTRFYLENPNCAEKLREAGYRRALRDHTWQRRFDELFRKLQLHTTASAIHVTR